MKNTIRVAAVCGMAWMATLSVLNQTARAGCDCNVPPTLWVLDDAEICMGADPGSLSGHTCGDDPESVASGNCDDCAECTDCEFELNYFDKDGNWRSGLTPGRNMLQASLEACGTPLYAEGYITVYRLASLEGPGKACAGESKTYTATTEPTGGEHLITWAVSNGGVPSPAIGPSATVTFPSSGYVTVMAICGENREVGVEVGASASAPESEACTAVEQLPPNKGASYMHVIKLFREWDTGTWSETFTWEEIAVSSTGDCGAPASIGLIEIDPSWSVSASLTANLFKWGAVGVSASYVSASSGTVDTFSKEGEDGIKFRIKAVLMKGDFQISNVRHFINPGTNIPINVPTSDSDHYTASDFTQITCRWCCT